MAGGGRSDEVEVDVLVHHDEDDEWVGELIRQGVSPGMCFGQWDGAVWMTLVFGAYRVQAVVIEWAVRLDVSHFVSFLIIYEWLNGGLPSLLDSLGVLHCVPFCCIYA